VLSGELAMHTGVTLLRVFGGFFIGAYPGVALRAPDGDVPPGALHDRSADRGAGS
jgi:hypothetical protein